MMILVNLDEESQNKINDIGTLITYPALSTNIFCTLIIVLVLFTKI